VSAAAGPALRITPDGLDPEQIAAAVVVLLVRIRAARATREDITDSGHRHRGGQAAHRRLGTAPWLLPPCSWQKPSLTIRH
jgi:hypothetical protein